MGAVKDLILSYSPEQYYPLDTAYAGTTLSNSGSGGQSTWTVGGTPLLISNGGPDGSGSWQLSLDKNAEVYFRQLSSANGTNPLFDPEITDVDYSIGTWFKIDPRPATGSFDTNMTVFQLGGELRFTAATLNGNNGQLLFSDATLTNAVPNIDDGEWHYFAERVYSHPTLSGYNKERYLDGQLINSVENIPDINYANYYQFGDNFVSGTDVYDSPIEVSHFYVAPSASITSTEIAAIWSAGQATGAVDVTIAEMPATASALSVDPTIAVTVGDNIYITTSITVDAEFLPNVTVLAQKFVNITAHVIMEADADLTNNVVVSTTQDFNFSSAEFIAEALMLDPSLSLGAMSASAEMGNHIPSVDFSYYQIIKNTNPYIYIYNGSTTAVVNDGYGNNTVTFGDITGNQDGGIPINLLGNGKSWYSDGTISTNHQIRFNAASQDDSFLPIQRTGNWASEVWIKSVGNVQDAIFIDTPAAIVSGYIGTSAPYGYEIELWTRDLTDPTQASISFVSTNKPLTPNQWHHIVLQQEQLPGGSYQLQLWVDGSLYHAQNDTNPILFTDPTGRRTNPRTSTAGQTFGIRSLENAYTDPDYDVSWGGVARNYQIYTDEIVYYDRALSSAEITYHYEYVILNSPDAIIPALALTADANFIGGNFFVTSNANYQPPLLTADADIVSPIITVGVSQDILSGFASASAEFQNPRIDFDTAITVGSMIAYAESGIPIFLDSAYSQYVLNNYSPYRYANFDSSNPLVDLGSDADYSLPQIAYSGTISEPGYGINNKSVLTAGTAYTDGIVLLESEYDDDWGTGTNTYHSSFWMRRSVDDQSTTGLRVLWNLNGAYDNQHVVLYQYQGNLVMQFNNGTGTYIQNSVALDLFDYQRHFIGINFDHTGANIFVELFVDGLLVMTTDLGTYSGTTINGIVPIGPNEPEANKPRLGVGCLITPFGSTALPVIPTNTRLFLDEVVWSKIELTTETALALYNEMPEQVFVSIFAEAFDASAEIINPIASAEVNLLSDIFVASTEIVAPTVSADFNNIVLAEAMAANAIINDATASQTVLILSSPMIASAFFSGVLLFDFVRAEPMIANIELPQTITVNSVPISQQHNIYIRYLREQSQITSIMSFAEVK